MAVQPRRFEQPIQWSLTALPATVVPNAILVVNGTMYVGAADGSAWNAASSGGGTEAWHEIGTSGTYGTNVGTFSSTRKARFRKTPDGKVHLSEAVAITGAVAQLATLVTLPAGYRPATGHVEAFFCTGSTNGAISVLDTGVLRWEGVALSSGAYLYLSSISFFTD